MSAGASERAGFMDAPLIGPALQKLVQKGLRASLATSLVLP